jgi:hypothetical protein
MRIGILYMGNDSTRLWGGAVISHYLGEALRQLGHDVWRVPALDWPMWEAELKRKSDCIISHGVPATRIPNCLWEATDLTIFWWLSEAFYSAETIMRTPFDGIATNSPEGARRLSRAGRPSALIELAAPVAFSSSSPKDEYRSFATYLGLYPHKTAAQLSLLLDPASEKGLTIWGRGWKTSSYRRFYRGILPLTEIGSLYRSVRVVLALTEERQKALGMLNNRLFEALASGAIVLSEDFPALQSHDLGRYVLLAHNANHARDLLESCASFDTGSCANPEGRACVLDRHTYHHRALEFLEFIRKLGGPSQAWDSRRPRKPATEVMFSGSLWMDQVAIGLQPGGGKPIYPEAWFGLSNIELTRSTAAPDTLVVRVRYPAGSASPTVARGTGAPLGGAQALISLPHGARDAVRLRYFVRFPEGFDFVKGGKLPGLFGGSVWSGGRVPDGTNGFSTRYMWRADGDGEVYLYVPACPRYGLSINRGGWRFKAGIWQLLEQEVRMNNVGERDGVLRVLVDGKLIFDLNDIEFRTTHVLNIEGIAFSTFFGGGDASWATPRTVNIDFCGIEVSDFA